MKVLAAARLNVTVSHTAYHSKLVDSKPHIYIPCVCRLIAIRTCTHKLFTYSRWGGR